MTIQIVFSLLLKVIVSALVIFSIHLAIPSLGASQYGVWVTLTSMASWFTLFDFGIGYSLKNRIASGISDNIINILVLGCFQFLIIISICMFITLAVAIFLLQPFNQYVKASCCIYIPIILTFPLTIGNYILQGQGKFKLVNSIMSINSVSMFIFFLSSEMMRGVTLIMPCIMFGLSILFQNIIMFVLAFKKYQLNPSYIIKYTYFSSSLDIIKNGGKFFILQISSLILYSSSNWIAYQNLTQTDVALFDTINKVFLFIVSLYNIAVSISWTEVSKAISKGNKKRQRQILYFLILLSIFTTALSFVIYINIYYIIGVISQHRLRVLTNQAQIFPFLVLVQTLAYSGAVFLNAHEKLNGQIILSLIAIPVFIFMSGIFFHYNFGISSLPLSSTLATCPALVYVLWNAKNLTA